MPNNLASRVSRTAIVLTTFAALFRILAFVRELLLAYTFGATSTADSYVAALYFPQFFMMLLANNTFGGSLVPRLIANREKTSILVFSFFIAGSISAVSLSIGAHELAHLLFPGFDQPTTAVVARLTQCMAPGTLFLSLCIPLTAALHARESFIAPAISNLALVATMLLGVISAPQLLGIYTVALGFTFGAGLQGVILWGALKNAGWRFRNRAALTLRECVSPFLESMPVLLVALAFLLVDVLLRSNASGLPPGSISALNYATKIVVLPGAIIAIPLSTIMLPRLALLDSTQGSSSAQAAGIDALSLLFAVLMPCSVAAYVLRHEVVSTLFGRGAFTSSTLTVTATALAALAPAIAFGPLTILLQTIHYSRGDQRTPVLSCIPLVAVIFIGGCFDSTRSNIFTVAGTYSAAWAASCLYLTFLFFRRSHLTQIVAALLDAIKVIASALIAGAVAAVAIVWANANHLNLLSRLIICGSLCLALYSLIMSFLYQARIRSLVARH